MKMMIIVLLFGIAVARAEQHQIKVFVDGKEVEAEVRPDGTLYIPSLAATNAPTPAVATTAPAPAPLAPVAPAPAPVAQPASPPPPASPAAPATQPAQQRITSSPIVASQAPVAPPPAPPVPTIRGKLIWYHNVWDLKSPDSGARVWLLTESEAARVAHDAGGTDREPIPANSLMQLADGRFPVAAANERGEFFFDHVPPGRYLLVLKSAHCWWNAPRDAHGKLRFKPVDVRDGAPIDFTFDFGRTPDALKP